MSSPYEPGQPYDPAYPYPASDATAPGSELSPVQGPSPYEAPYSSPTAPPYGYTQPAFYNPGWAAPAVPEPYPYWAPSVPPVPPPPTSRRGHWAYVAGAAAIVAAVVVAVVGYAHSTTSGNAVANGNAGEGIGNGSFLPGTNGSGGSGQFPFGSGLGTGSGTGNSTTSTGTATARQEIGVVDVDTVLGYENAEAAGTGLVLDSSGDVLTNNHVIDGATKIEVTVVATGRTYAATVVGTVPSKDIAVIHLTKASGLAIANFGDSSTVKVGDSITGVGNAGGKGGVPSAAVGTVTALNQSITATDETGDDSELLHGVIATNAGILAGDSGGPLFNSSDEVVGIDTAASSQHTAGYAIPIDSALSLAAEIEKGVQTSSVHIGVPGFMGVTVVNTNGGVGLNSVLPGPAANAGLTGGDVITAIDGSQVKTAAQLKAAVSVHKPGQQITVTYTDTSGSSHTATLTLESGPAD
jgi:S1-C subfamily serine protease